MKIVCRMSSVPLTMFKTIVYIKKGAPFSLLLYMSHGDFDWHQLTASAHAKACSEKSCFILIYVLYKDSKKERTSVWVSSNFLTAITIIITSWHKILKIFKIWIITCVLFCLWCTSEDFNIYLIILSFMTNHSLHPYNPLFISHAFCATWCGT